MVLVFLDIFANRKGKDTGINIKNFGTLEVLYPDSEIVFNVSEKRTIIKGMKEKRIKGCSKND